LQLGHWDADQLLVKKGFDFVPGIGPKRLGNVIATEGGK